MKTPLQKSYPGSARLTRWKRWAYSLSTSSIRLLWYMSTALAVWTWCDKAHCRCAKRIVWELI